MKSFKSILYIYQKTACWARKEILCHIFKERKTVPSAYSIRNSPWGYLGHNLVLGIRFILNANCLLIEYFEGLLKCCLLFTLKWKKFQSDIFWILIPYSHCLFIFSLTFNLLAMTLSCCPCRLLGEHSPTSLIFGLWSARRGQPGDHACRIAVRVINNSNKSNIIYEHVIHNRDRWSISFNLVYNLMRDKKITISTL